MEGRTENMHDALDDALDDGLGDALDGAMGEALVNSSESLESDSSDGLESHSSDVRMEDGSEAGPEELRAHVESLIAERAAEVEAARGARGAPNISEF
jgi:hypothetical protein